MSDQPDEAPLEMRVLRGAPTPEELAAITAVVSEAYDQEASSAIAEEDAPTSAWGHPRGAARRVPRRGSVWGRFEG